MKNLMTAHSWYCFKWIHETKKMDCNVMLIEPGVMIMANSFLYLCTSLYCKRSAASFYYLYNQKKTKYSKK